jgi:16S rRNA G966 N2-methylase RsmD
MDINYKKEENNIKLKGDIEGMYSLSYKEDADLVSNIIKEKFGDVKILDGTSGIGGNSISFGLNFSNTILIEINKERFEYLKINTKLYNLTSILYNDDMLNHLNDDYDLIFIDPPWGGPNYKLETSISLSLSNITLKDLTKKLRILGKIIVYKLPFNYNLNDFSEHNYEIYNIKNYLIIIIY